MIETDEWNEGYDAFRLDKPYEDCPFSSGEDRIQWQEGWMQSKSDRETQ